MAIGRPISLWREHFHFPIRARIRYPPPMLDYALGFGFLALIVAVFYFALRLGQVFHITIKEGRIESVKGKVSAEYQHDVEKICELWSLKNGHIKGIRAGRRIRITTGGDLAGKYRRSFQNAWDHPI